MSRRPVKDIMSLVLKTGKVLEVLLSWSGCRTCENVMDHWLDGMENRLISMMGLYRMTSLKLLKVVVCHLPEAYRRLQRLSSPLVAKASTVCA